MKSLGLYIHIPFCLRKCHYCDFVSYPDMTQTIDAYIDALLMEANLYRDYISQRHIDTVFIGGGTPSLLSAAQISRLVSGLQETQHFEPTEFTIETNPESLTDEKLSAYKDIGVNRVSIGLQSHDNDTLRGIGRAHSFELFLAAYENAAKHFANINIDTIFGLPNQSLQSFCTTLAHLISLSPSHISSYALKLEKGTPLRETFAGTDDETDREMYHNAIEMLTDADYLHYETSNFAKLNRECKHNLKYWKGETYLGLGVAAHSYPFTDTRTSNTSDINQYLQILSEERKPVAQSLMLSSKDLMEEFIMLHLRLSQGLAFSAFNRKFNMDFQLEYRDAIISAKRHDLITVSKHSIKPTIKGFDLQNTLIAKFMK